MKRVSSAFLALALAASVAWAEVPTSNVLYRVLRLRTDNGTGSAFTIEVGGRQYLITARHNLEGFEGEIELWLGGGWTRFKGRAIYPANEAVDIAALDLGRPVTITYPLEATAGGLILGQQAFFLGYPYGLGTPGIPSAPPELGGIAFVKSGIVSALTRERSANVIYLDGYNNPGFSGGPIVFWHAERRQFRVAGVVGGYRNEALPVLKRKDLKNPAARAHENLYTRANSGIVVGYDIRHVVQAIRATQREASSR